MIAIHAIIYHRGKGEEGDSTREGVTRTQEGESGVKSSQEDFEEGRRKGRGERTPLGKA